MPARVSELAYSRMRGGITIISHRVDSGLLYTDKFSFTITHGRKLDNRKQANKGPSYSRSRSQIVLGLCILWPLGAIYSTIWSWLFRDTFCLMPTRGIGNVDRGFVISGG